MSAIDLSRTPALAADEHFDLQSRLWVYTCARPLTQEEATFAQQQLDAFCRQWTAHNHALKARAEVFENQLLILMVDETQAGASGCSIDTSVHFLEKLSQHLAVDLFERMRFGWVDEQGQVQFAKRPEFSILVAEGKIGTDTLVLDTLVQTRGQMAERWLIPFGKSWHRRVAG